MTAVPVPQVSAFDIAAAVFDVLKPIGTRIAGLCVCQSAEASVWSVNYEVDGEFPAPHQDNIEEARASFQRVQPPNAAVRHVVVCVIKPGGLPIRKWQVTYLVK